MTDEPSNPERDAIAAERDLRSKSSLVDYLAGPMDAPGILAKMGLVEPAGPIVLPRHVWMYWHDGWHNAPEVAKLCLQSWTMRNPGYEVHALDYRSLGDFLLNPPVHYEKTKLRSFSDRVRLRLLRTHGGVWADATNFCTQPLDPWIADMVSPARFFAFALPGADRPIASWFLAATLQSPLVAAWEELVTHYFTHIEREERKLHAYFFIHYIFEFALSQSSVLQALWDVMPKEPAGGTGSVSRLAGLQAADQTEGLRRKTRVKIAMALTESRMQKLTWKGAMRAQTRGAQKVLSLLRKNLRN